MVGTLARFVIESTFAPPIDGPIKEKNGFLVETSPRFVRAAPNWRPKRRITSSKFETPSTLSYSNKMDSKNNWTTFGLCSAESLRGIKSLIFKITPGKCVSKANFYTHQKKSHVPTVILKFLTTTPNLTSNFET